MASRSSQPTKRLFIRRFYWILLWLWLWIHFFLFMGYQDLHFQFYFGDINPPTRKRFSRQIQLILPTLISPILNSTPCSCREPEYKPLRKRFIFCREDLRRSIHTRERHQSWIQFKSSFFLSLSSFGEDEYSLKFPYSFLMLLSQERKAYARNES